MSTPPIPATPATEAPGYVPPIILRNKGVPVTLYRVVDGQVQMSSDAEDAEPVTRTVHLRFTSNHVADIEEAFDGLRANVPIIETTPALDPQGKPLVGPDGPVMDAKVVGREERVYYGMEAFQKAMEIKQASTVRRVLAIAFGTTVEEMGTSMIPARQIDYQNAVGVAWSIAQGVDPTDAAKVLAQANGAVAAARTSLASRLEKTLEKVLGSTTDGPGPTGPPPGSPPVEA